MLAQTTAPETATAAPTVFPTTVVLRTADLVEFAVPMTQLMSSKSVVDCLSGKQSNVTLLNAKSSVPVIEVAHVSSLIMSKVLLFAQSNVDAEEYVENAFTISEQDLALFTSETNEDLLQLAYAANTLEMPALLHIVGEIIATKINSFEGGEINTLFNLEAMEVDTADQEGEIEEGGDWEEMEESEEADKADK